MSDDTQLVVERLTTFFYDLAKAVPIGTLNRVLINAFPEGKIKHCDNELEGWARAFALQVITGKFKFTPEQVAMMRRES